MKKINISEPYFDQEEFNEISKVLDSKWVTQGSKTELFERRFAEYHKVGNAIAVTSCTTGLELVLRAFGIGNGDDVIIPSLSWVATANAIKILGANPIFVDVEYETCNLDITKVKDAITPKTKAIVPVHLFGRCIDISKLKAILPSHILIIEDAACAIGASYHGNYCGQESDAAVFSFHPRKVITTGEGGMIILNSNEIAQKLRQMRNHGQSLIHSTRIEFECISDVDDLGFNYRMTDIQASMGLAQMKKLDFLIYQRNLVADFYFDIFKDFKNILLPKKVGNKDIVTWQSFVVLLDTNVSYLRNECIAYLQSKGIQTRPATHCIPMLTYYKQSKTSVDSYRISKNIFVSSISLPIYVGLSRDDISYIHQVLCDFFKMHNVEC